MRDCLMRPIPEIYAAARCLSAALKAHLEGDQSAASALLLKANDPIVWQFAEFGWGKGCMERHGICIDPNGLPCLPLLERPVPRMPTLDVRAKVIARDGHHCRFCGMPVISTQVRDRFRKLYPLEVPWGKTNRDKHAAFQCMWLQFDHIVPNSRGGDSSVENIVVTCAPCNFGRMEATLEEANLSHPFDRPVVPTWYGASTWNGLLEMLGGAVST